MHEELKRKWVKALLSGKYKQGKHALRSNHGYCCLGVLVESCNGKTDINTYGYLNDADTRGLGLDEEDQKELASVNDAGVPFDMIAGLIETAL